MQNKINGLTESMTLAATELGAEIIREIAQQVLIQKPHMPVSEFLVILDDQIKIMRDKVTANKHR
jgi:hypothetical protein